MRDQTGRTRAHRVVDPRASTAPPVGKAPAAVKSSGGVGGRGAAGLALVMAVASFLGSPSPTGAAPTAKYYFQVHDVQSRVPLEGDIRQFTGDALKAELASRPEWESNLGGASDPDAVVAELKRRRLSGFDVVVKIADLKKEVKEPNPGSRLKRLSVTVKLSVLGTTLPGQKIAFGGDGEAGTEAELTERRMESEGQAMIKDSIKDALKQAVDQAVLKLGTPVAAPHNESKRKRKKN